jgi:hypothetical protein
MPPRTDPALFLVEPSVSGRISLLLDLPSPPGATMSEQSEVLESYCPGSRVHALIDNPKEEGIDEG